LANNLQGIGEEGAAMTKRLNPDVRTESSADAAVGAGSVSPIRQLVQKLSSPRSVERERARSELVALGAATVPDLLEAFESGDERGRLEICKALTEIAHSSAASMLLRRLEDDHQELRWIAAEGLLNIGGPAVEPLLLALIDRASAHTILEGAVHVLRGLSRRVSEPIFEPVISAVRGVEPGASVPPAAEAALFKWRAIWSEPARGRSVSPTLEPHSAKAWYDRRV
jgi:HEAT repeat protein